MIKVVSSEKIPIKIWASDLEESALIQAKNLANLPFAFKHIVINADGHCGYGMPIGGVLATKNTIIPNAVGADISCGMCAMRTSLKNITKDQIKKILGGSKENKGGVRSNIPVGKNHNNKNQEWEGFDSAPNLQVIQENLNKARKSLKSLGSGNHFWELQKGSDGYIWIMIHSGSRNLGFKIAEYYNSLAMEMCKKWHSDVPFKNKEDSLAFFPMDSQEGQDYFNAMNYAMKFSYENRKRMMEVSKECILEIIPDCEFCDLINVHHNYARMENHFGSNVMVHRKGATSAKEGEIGIIPGSQGTKSYIVSGLGNAESFCSCSHGAGRQMSRKKAQENLNLEEEKKKLDDQGIIHGIRHKSDLDEAAGAYKDIDVVMKNQRDLVEIVTELSPLAVMKG